MREWEEKYKTCVEELNVCKSELASCKGELASCKNELATCKGEITSFKNELNVLNNEIKKVNSKVDDKSKPTLSKKVSIHQTKENANGANATVSKTNTFAAATSSNTNGFASISNEVVLSTNSGLPNGKASRRNEIHCPILYDEEEFFSACIFNNEMKAFQFGFYFDEDDEDQFCISLYRCRGKFDDQFNCIQNEFTEGFPLQIMIATNDGEDCTIVFMKNIWTIGYGYYRSLGEDYFLGSFENFDANGYVYLSYEFLY